VWGLKKRIVAKSVVTLDVKPWDDETDMDVLIANVRSIQQGSFHTFRSALLPATADTI